MLPVAPPVRADEQAIRIRSHIQICSRTRKCRHFVQGRRGVKISQAQVKVNSVRVSSEVCRRLHDNLFLPSLLQFKPILVDLQDILLVRSSVFFVAEPLDQVV